MAEFVTGRRLGEEVYDIIFNARKQLLIVSPFIKLDDYFKREVFNKHKSNAELHIIIAFGKTNITLAEVSIRVISSISRSLIISQLFMFRIFTLNFMRMNLKVL